MEYEYKKEYIVGFVVLVVLAAFQYSNHMRLAALEKGGAVSLVAVEAVAQKHLTPVTVQVTSFLGGSDIVGEVTAGSIKTLKNITLLITKDTSVQGVLSDIAPLAYVDALVDEELLKDGRVPIISMVIRAAQPMPEIEEVSTSTPGKI